MNLPLLRISNLHARIGDTKILSGLSLEIFPGEVHAIMGPNGSGKSTLSKIIAGHPDYEVTEGTIEIESGFQMKNLLTLAPEERAREGVFLGYQYPVEIPGVTNLVFLRAAFNAVCKYHGAAEMDEPQFLAYAEKRAALVDFDTRFLERPVNAGLSGGEKKRNELFQMAVLAPRLAYLDETDSGLDVDALRAVGQGLNRLRRPEQSILLVTHYQRLLNYIKPDRIHLLVGGRIAQSGGPELALAVEEKGYDFAR